MGVIINGKKLVIIAIPKTIHSVLPKDGGNMEVIW